MLPSMICACPTATPIRFPLRRLRIFTRPLATCGESLDDAERQQILAALEKANWTVAGPNGAAALLGMKRSTLQSRMQKLAIRISRRGA